MTPLLILLVFSILARTSTSITYLPTYLRLNEPGGIWSETEYGDGVVIGFVDTGIWRESPSFHDRGLGPAKPSWKGVCERGNSNFTCNRKIIGARAPYCEGPPHPAMAPTDYVIGHGTFVAAIAAGSPVENVSIAGYANGTAIGVAPRARIAVYDLFDAEMDNLTCKGNASANSTTEAFEFAVNDGVDIISTSMATDMKEAASFRDAIPFSAFKAERKGVLFVSATGNDGPSPYTARNTAPWMTSVGAGIIDREFPSYSILGNGKAVMSESLYTGPPNFVDTAPLVKVDECGNDNTTFAHLVKGKFAVCRSCVLLNETLFQIFGGLGAFCIREIVGEAVGVVPSAEIPVLAIPYSGAIELQSYMNTTKNPFATIKITQGLTVYGRVRAPMVSRWTSRGPGLISPEIIKPDIIAPGNRILSAVPRPVHPDFPYRLDSGTSVACPIIAGVGALIKKKHPKWSPAMIRSAMMTTASITDNKGLPLMTTDLEMATPFDMGAGEVNPSRVLRPGLVYDTSTQDYINFMCTLNFPKEHIEAHVDGPYTCNKFKTGITELNYPSIGVVFNKNRRSVVVPRTVTKVSGGHEAYKVSILNHFPDKFKVEVVPDTLFFKGKGQKASFKVNITALHMIETTSEPRTNSSEDGKPFPLYSDKSFAHMIWESRDHVVTSPIGLLWEILPHPSSN